MRPTALDDDRREMLFVDLPPKADLSQASFVYAMQAGCPGERSSGSGGSGAGAGRRRVIPNGSPSSRRGRRHPFSRGKMGDIFWGVQEADHAQCRGALSKDRHSRCWSAGTPVEGRRAIAALAAISTLLQQAAFHLLVTPLTDVHTCTRHEDCIDLLLRSCFEARLRATWWPTKPLCQRRPEYQAAID